jgi:inorganic pyrophosphatase
MTIDSLPAVRDDGLLNVIVETPRGSAVKLKFDGPTGLMMLSRPIPLGLAYPFDWGFVAGTRAPDGDPLDAMLVWDSAAYPGVLVPCRPIGLLQVDQLAADRRHRERNDRLLAIPGKAARLDGIQSISDVSERTREELLRFFLAVVAFEGKDIKVLGWDGPDAAMAAVRLAQAVPEPADIPFK